MSGGDGRGHRQVAAGEPLPEAQQIGSEPALLGREQRAGAAESGGDFVADEQDVVVAAGGTEGGECLGGRGLHTGRTLHERLDDDRRQFVTVRLDHRHRDVETARIGERRRAQHREAQRSKRLGPEPAVISD